MQGANTLINTQDCVLVENTQDGAIGRKHTYTGTTHLVMGSAHAGILVNYPRIFSSWEELHIFSFFLLIIDYFSKILNIYIQRLHLMKALTL